MDDDLLVERDQFETVKINDRLYPRKNTFDVFLEMFSKYPTRCTYHPGQSPFRTQWVAAGVGAGAAVRWTPTDHKSSRDENEIADSAIAGFGVFYCVSGKAELVQSGKTIEVKRGRAVIYDLDAPMKIDMTAAGKKDFLNVSFQRAEGEKLLNPARLMSPGLLTEWADLLASVLANKRGSELNHVYAAGESLFEAHLQAAQPDDGCLAWSATASQDLFGRMLQFIETDIRNDALSPTLLANHFGVSIRYVHKLFAANGLTAQRHITETRLSLAALDLVHSVELVSILSLAYRWGFTDPSTFSRAFRARFGCSPREYRSRRR